MEIMVRASVIYFFLFAVARGTGKRELSQMTAFELLLLVIMGDLIQQGVTQEDMSLIGATLAVGTITAWILLFNFAGYHWRRIRPALEGVPLVVLRGGQPVQEAMKLERFTLDELCEAARAQGIADLSDVEVAILEPDGRVSFIKQSGQQHQPDEKSIT
jgi:uncharacterized membrane protein YcaP (DUF421 family)